MQCLKLALKHKETHLRKSRRQVGKIEEIKRKKLRRSPRTQRKKDLDGDKTDWKRPNEKFKAGDWDRPCLNVEECSEIHSISKCPVTPKEKRCELLDKHFDTKKSTKKSARAAVLRSASELSRKAEEGRYKELLNYIEMVALKDSDAVYYTIPSNVFESISAKNPVILGERLKVPMILDAALNMDKSRKSAATSRNRSPQRSIILPQKGLAVRIRGVQFLIADRERPDILLGMPLLKAMGFDFNQHLYCIAALIDGKSKEKLQEGNSTFAPASYRGVNYNDIEEVPIELPECLQAGFGFDTVVEIDEAITSAVDGAKKNGLSAPSTENLQALLQKNRPCFGIKLESHPPADVRRLSIKLNTKRQAVSHSTTVALICTKSFHQTYYQAIRKTCAVYKKDQPRWTCPGLAVPKTGIDTLHCTVDLRRTNSRTVPLPSAKPHVESLM